MIYANIYHNVSLPFYNSGHASIAFEPNFKEYKNLLYYISPL